MEGPRGCTVGLGGSRNGPSMARQSRPGPGLAVLMVGSRFAGPLHVHERLSAGDVIGGRHVLGRLRARSSHALGEPLPGRLSAARFLHPGTSFVNSFYQKSASQPTCSHPLFLLQTLERVCPSGQRRASSCHSSTTHCAAQRLSAPWQANNSKSLIPSSI